MKQKRAGLPAPTKEMSLRAAAGRVAPRLSGRIETSSVQEVFCFHIACWSSRASDLLARIETNGYIFNIRYFTQCVGRIANPPYCFNVRYFTRCGVKSFPNFSIIIAS
jgi:hypothetical protein